MTRAEVQQRASGIWIPASRITTATALVGLLVLGYQVVRGISQLQFQVAELTSAQQAANRSLATQMQDLQGLTGRVITVENKEAEHERRISLLEARRP